MQPPTQHAGECSNSSAAPILGICVTAQPSRSIKNINICALVRLVSKWTNKTTTKMSSLVLSLLWPEMTYWEGRLAGSPGKGGWQVPPQFQEQLILLLMTTSHVEVHNGAMQQKPGTAPAPLHFFDFLVLRHSAAKLPAQKLLRGFENVRQGYQVAFFQNVPSAVRIFQLQLGQLLPQSFVASGRYLHVPDRWPCAGVRPGVSTSPCSRHECIRTRLPRTCISVDEHTAASWPHPLPTLVRTQNE